MDHPHLRTRRIGATTLLIVVAMVLGACSNTSSRALVGTTTTTAASDVTVVEDPPPRHPAAARLEDPRHPQRRAPGRSRARPSRLPSPSPGARAPSVGAVTGPDGPVAGATVRIERFVGTASGSIQVGTDGGGHFTADRRPRAAATACGPGSSRTCPPFTSPTGFVADGDSLDLTRDLERHNAITLQVASALATLSSVEPDGVRALLTQETVDADGIVRAAGRGGDVRSPWCGVTGIAITSPNPATTDATGAAELGRPCTAPRAPHSGRRPRRLHRRPRRSATLPGVRHRPRRPRRRTVARPRRPPMATDRPPRPRHAADRARRTG